MSGWAGWRWVTPEMGRLLDAAPDGYAVAKAILERFDRCDAAGFPMRLVEGEVEALREFVAKVEGAK